MFQFLETNIRTKKVWNENKNIYELYSKWSTLWNQFWELCERQEKLFYAAKDSFSWTKIYFILGNIFFKIPKNLITSAFFTKTDMHRYISAKVSNAALVKLTN